MLPVSMYKEEGCERERYMSWEQFFTAFLVEKTSDSYLQYAKGKLNLIIGQSGFTP